MPPTDNEQEQNIQEPPQLTDEENLLLEDELEEQFQEEEAQETEEQRLEREARLQVERDLHFTTQAHDLLNYERRDREEELIIAQALETDEGRTALAQAMVEPIRRSLEYQSVGRRLLMVDALPQGALDRYERDVAAVAVAIGRRQEKFLADMEYVTGGLPIIEHKFRAFGFTRNDVSRYDLMDLED